MPNASGRSNRDVVKPWWNGLDVTRRPRNMWLIDFGTDMPLEEAELYEQPLAYVREHVKPERDENNRAAYRERWWIHNEAQPSMRAAIAPLSRYLVTPHVSKHRVFMWLESTIVPDHQLIVVARDDDYFFGVLRSRFHEKWALRMGTWLGKGNDPRYTPTTTFETFPFPWSPRQEPTDHPAYFAISAAAKQLREAWLNPPGVSGKALEQRTLTNLYNALLVFRGDPPAECKKHPKIVPAAGDFVPRLADLHAALDRTVCDAYGWEYAVLDDDEGILRRLLALNLERAR